ncbi:MAG: hypothetical protein L0212_07830 [Acidobacteria bacterium]|nr:hypothetical protein [Acidobacteriota bacterium]
MKNLLAAALAILAPALLALASGSQRSQAEHVVLVSENEPGQTLIVRGTVYAPDGETPVPGIRLNVHHTDSMGYYCMLPSPERDRTLPRDNCPDSPPNTARIRTTLTTDAQGRFEFHTIKPGSYPNSRNPAHIHFQASGAGYPAQWPHDLNFAGDPFIPEAEVAAQEKLGKFRVICDPQPAGRGKALLCEYNFRLERK